MSKRVYISSHDKQQAQDLAAKLRERGHEIVSTWHDELSIPDSPGSEWWKVRIYANKNKIRNADTLVLVAGPDKYPGEKFVEFGIALTYGLELVVFGDRYENGMVSVARLARTPDEI